MQHKLKRTLLNTLDCLDLLLNQYRIWTLLQNLASNHILVKEIHEKL